MKNPLDYNILSHPINVPQHKGTQLILPDVRSIMSLTWKERFSFPIAEPMIASEV